jgi:hypothetical protein
MSTVLTFVCILQVFKSSLGIAINLVAPNGYQQFVFEGPFVISLARVGAAVCLMERFGCEWYEAGLNQAAQDFLA